MEPQQLPGSDTDVYFGDAEKPLPDWRAETKDEEDSDDDVLTDEQRDAVNGVLGFDSAELFSEVPAPDSLTPPNSK